MNGHISVWTLMDVYEQFSTTFPDGAQSIPENAVGVADLLDEARWEMEFLLSMQVPAGEAQAGMVHHKMHDEAWAALPLLPPTEVNNDSTHEIAGEGRYVYAPHHRRDSEPGGDRCAVWAHLGRDGRGVCGALPGWR